MLFIISITMLIVPDENLIPTSSGTTIYVPTDYPTIQEAINAAKDGDTVYVYSGTYYERIGVNKAINLIGDGPDSTTICGQSAGQTVYVNTDWVNITGFTITTDNPNVEGLIIYSDHVTIARNIFTISEIGIYIQKSSAITMMDNIMLHNGIYIEGYSLEHWNTHEIDFTNTVNGKPIWYLKDLTEGVVPSNAGQVILANCTNVNVVGQEITDVTVGISLGFSSHNNITNNNITSCRRYYGMGLIYSNGNNIMGNLISTPRGDGFYLNHSSWNNIIGNNISDNRGGDGIHLRDSYENRIIGNTLFSNIRKGIWVYYSDGNYIADNNISWNGCGIEVLRSSYNYIENNTCVRNHNDGIVFGLAPRNSAKNNHCYKNGNGIFIATYSNETDVIGNYISYSRNDGIPVKFSCRNNIIDNTIISNSRKGIYLWFSHENYFFNNSITSTEESGIYFLQSRRNIIHDNKIQNNNIHGMYLYALSNNNIITDNIISSNKYDGILVEYSSNNKIKRNDISDNLGGLNLSTPPVSNLNSSYNIISDNNITNNERGIWLYSALTNAIIGNNISLNNDDGIRLLTSSDMNGIIGNTIFSNNGYGIYLSESSRNSIYHNYILNNAIQAFDYTIDTNRWDIGYPLGGNFWSDFDEPSEGAYDDYQGSDQDILGSDGIVDNGTIGGGGKNPYVIDSDSQDNYPLVIPPVMTPTLHIKASADGRDAILYWDQPSIFGVSHYLIYRSEDQTNFDFDDVWVNTKTDTQPGESLSNPLRNTWIDFNASVPGNKNYREQYYYVIQSVYESGKMSPSSRTVGKWTRSFPRGISTFSLPLEPIDPLYVDHCTQSMNATYIKYMSPDQHTWRQHNFDDGINNNTQMILGEGYEVKLSNQTVFTFTGLPGAMISYYGNGGFLGFDPTTEADCLEVTIQENGDVNLTWEEPGSMGPGDYYYEIYFSNKRDGFFGYVDFDYSQVCSPVGFGTNNVTHVGAQANDPGKRLYYMVVPFNAMGIRGTSTYSIGIWTEEYLSQYDTMGIPLKLDVNHTADWYCDNIPNTVGINYFNYNGQRWAWHATRMLVGAYDTVLEMTEGYQISTSDTTEFTFIGV
ncbi:MAG: right-handed parallel beta-helix repeat-containing protein [Thermoplasmata archaeon]|nr:MAG: right-handed parallel beta-helix repeat-containing protein [Thermoplasmata archaeon]